MKRVFSTGGIVFNNKGQILLIKSISLRDEKILHWKFPKGHLEDKESMQDGALREVEEETGIKAKIISKVGDSKYTLTYKNEKFFKIVSFFLMEYVSGNLKPQVGEIEEVKWFSPEEALKILSFSADKKLLEKAVDIYGEKYR